MQPDDAVDGLDALYREAPVVAGLATQIPFGIEDVGGELVSMFSEGLYGDPRDALREYVQNAVDAGSSTVLLRFTGRDLHVVDEGAGMDFDDLVAARRIGKSTKSSATVSVGFRGIGVYAGFQICDQVKIITRKANSDRRWTLTFDFAAMRAILLANRLLIKRNAASDLGPLISEHTTVAFEPAVATDPSGTSVVLESISKAAYHELSEPIELKAYLRRTLPVGYDPKFTYREQVVEQLKRNVPDYKTVQIRLRIDDLEIDEEVVRNFPTGLLPPVFTDAVWPAASNEVRAFVWGCHSERTRLNEDAGLFFRLKGFTIGSGRELRALFKRPVVYDWYIGEVHIVDNRVIPNVARNDFESNQARRDLYSALKAPCEDFEARAVAYQTFMRAVHVIGEIEDTINSFKSVDQQVDPIERYESIGKLEARLAIQRIPMRSIPSQEANAEAARARKKQLSDDLKLMRTQWREKVDGRAPDVYQKPIDAKAAKKSGSEVEKRVAAQHNEVKDSEVEEPVLADGHWLEEVFAQRGWRLTAQAREALAVVAQALADAELTTEKWRTRFIGLLDSILSRGS